MQNYHLINQKAATIGTFILLVLVAATTVKLGWHLADEPFTGVDLLKKHSRQNERLNLPFNLFGGFKVVKKHTSIKKTRLNLELIGIVSQPKRSLVIIKKDGSKTEKIYNIGDSINRDTKVKSIHSKYIIIDHAGDDEKLSLKSKISQKYGKLSTKKNSVTISKHNKRKIKSYLQQLGTNPQKLLSVIKINPNFTKNGLYGFIISPGKERNLFKELGFKNRDVILNINDTSLNDLSTAVALTPTLANQNQFDIIIDRGGQMTSLSFNLE